jgi:hypothetical protein
MSLVDPLFMGRYRTLSIQQSNTTIPDYDFQIKYSKTTLWGYFTVNCIALPLAIVTFIGVILFTVFKKQPVSSRHVAPYLGLTYIIFNSLLSIIFKLLLYTNVMTSDFELYFWFFLIALQQAAAMAYVVQTVRYYIMRGMYHNIGEDVQTHLRVLKRITSKKLFLAIVFVYGVFAWVYSTIWTLLFLLKQVDATTLTRGREFVFLAFNIAMVLVVFAAVLYDLIWTNRRVLFVKCAWGDYFTIYDPLRFRIEGGLLITAWIFLYFSSVFSYFVQPSTNPYGLAVGSVILYALGTFLYILAFGGLACIYALIFVIRDRHKLKSLKVGNLSTLTGEQKLYKVLLDEPDGFNLISMYCKHELSAENLRAWVDLNKVIPKWATSSEQERVAALHKIYERYIKPDAELEINIQNAVRNAFLLLIGKGSFIANNNPVRKEGLTDSEMQLEVLMELNKSVVENLADTFARLEETKNFKVYWVTLLEREKIEDKSNFAL